MTATDTPAYDGLVQVVRRRLVNHMFEVGASLEDALQDLSDREGSARAALAETELREILTTERPSRCCALVLEWLQEYGLVGEIFAEFGVQAFLDGLDGF